MEVLLSMVCSAFGLLPLVLLVWIVYLRFFDQPPARRANGKDRRRAAASGGANDPRLDFMRHVMVVIARLAKADGVVVKSEVDAACRIFDVLDMPREDIQRLKAAFNEAVKCPDRWSVYQHLDLIADYAPILEVRVFIYELLWDVACADGELAAAEKEILRRACAHLALDERLFRINYARREGSFVDREQQDRGRGAWHGERESTDARSGSILEDYATLGCPASATDDELKASYRKMAKAYHPDLLRANNVPEELIAVANAKMSKLNAAWDRVRRARGI